MCVDRRTDLAQLTTPHVADTGCLASAHSRLSGYRILKRNQPRTRWPTHTQRSKRWGCALVWLVLILIWGRCTGAVPHDRVGVLVGDDLNVNNGFSIPVAVGFPADSRSISSSGGGSSNSPRISASSSVRLRAFSFSIAKAGWVLGSRGPAMIESNTLSKGFVIPTSTDTTFFAANPLLSRRIFDRRELHRIRDIRIGVIFSKLSG